MPSKSLLIVFDDPIQREQLATVLRAEGYTVAVAADGVEALEHMQRPPATDLVLLDMMVPPPAHDG
jgi:CheY-like chemotaxis protein